VRGFSRALVHAGNIRTNHSCGRAPASGGHRRRSTQSGSRRNAKRLTPPGWTPMSPWCPAWSRSGGRHKCRLSAGHRV